VVEYGREEAAGFGGLFFWPASGKRPAALPDYAPMK
jgi:hypothetical protein